MGSRRVHFSKCSKTRTKAPPHFLKCQPISLKTSHIFHKFQPFSSKTPPNFHKFQSLSFRTPPNLLKFQPVLFMSLGKSFSPLLPSLIPITTAPADKSCGPSLASKESNSPKKSQREFHGNIVAICQKQGKRTQTLPREKKNDVFGFRFFPILEG